MTNLVWIRDWVKSTFISAFVIFGAIWTFAEPIGISTGWGLFFILLSSSIVTSTIYTLIKALIIARSTINKLQDEIRENRSELIRLKEQVSYCCVMNQKVPICPIGVTAIIPQMEATVTSTIEEAQHSFKWLGLSSFNVLHNHKELFAKKKYVQFEFLIANPRNDSLAKEVDTFYGDVKGRLGAKKLIAESDTLLTDFIENVNQNIKVDHHNQMPTFRTIIVDNKTAYVSFYERGIDALHSVQLKIEDKPDAIFSIFKWFPMFYEKTLITEKLINPRI